MRSLRAGQLVEIVKGQEAVGERGQLLAWDAAGGHWSIATFGARTVAATEDVLRPLDSSDLETLGFDIALGPMSDMEVMGAELTDNLAQKGFAVCKLFMSPDDLGDMISSADRIAASGAFTRLAAELEPGYLGKEGTGKTLALDMDVPETASAVRDSALRVAEESVATVGTILRPFVQREFGFDLESRSTSMLSLPFNGDEAEYESPELGNEDAAAYLMMMWRAKLMVIFNGGPGASTLTLFPKNGGDEPAAVLEPGMLAVFMLDRFKFSYEPASKALTLSTFYLDSPKEYTIDNIYGDVSTVSGALAGPAAPAAKDPITVVSLATRYAFGADEPWKLWVGYAKAGFDTQTRHPAMRWDCDTYYEEGADQTSGKSYTCHGGFSDGIELFDCRFFDISPAEAKGMDPTQRQVLEVSYIALQGAGYNKRDLQAKPANIAAFVGLDKNEWQSIPKDQAGGFGASNSANAITANRFNYCMNLKGASMTIDTACSSSLVAQHTGKLYLMFKHYDPCEAVITCGVNLSLSPLSYLGCCAAGMHSHKGRCFTYNSSADGYARGEATAATGIKLKTFDGEVGDFCMLAGSQVNQDGRSASLTAPNGPAQERCSVAVIKEVGIRTPEIDTTECHGTGTSLGDPIEIGAYRKVMARDPREEPVVITTSKSNIGHCEGSAGISGFMKCILMCLYAEGCPNVHLSSLNPHLDMDGFPGVIVSEGVGFRADSSYNGVLSFGFGGTNACATCWGTNLMTSRASGSKDVMQYVMRKIHDAPAQEVTITGDDWEEWELDFPIKDPKVSDKWDVELDEDGMVMYLKQEAQPQDVGNDYFLSGSFNSWRHEPMMQDTSLPGLYVGEITIGPSGYEDFVANADQDDGLSYFPGEARCSSRGTAVRGPGKREKDHHWQIKGCEGEKYRVELYINKARTVSISWIREQ